MKSVAATGVVFVGLSLLVALSLSSGVQALQAPVEPQNFSPASGFLTHITTDKPIYRLGEKVHVRGVLLHADGHTPGGIGTALVEIRGPRGETVTSQHVGIIDSIAGFSWDIPSSLAGGEYVVRISHPFTGDVAAERKFDIRAYRAPRLKSQIVFVRDGYGPGDTVGADLHVARAEGGFPEGAKVSVIARVDGDEVSKSETVVDRLGNAHARFKLPAVIARGEGTLAMIIEDGGTVETASKTIPILLQTLDVAIYPEGGDLIAGLQNRVYVEAKTPSGKPADMAGVIVNAKDREVGRFRTEHEGRGRFSFVPARGETYSLRVTEPAGIKATFRLPTIKKSGVVLTSTSDVATTKQDVAVRIVATEDSTYGISLSQRGREYAFKSIALRANNPTEVAFTLPRTLDGVIVATVYDDRKIPIAERLLFRQPERGLRVHVTPDRQDYVPGDKVTLRVSTTDETGKPVGGVVGLTVTDSSVLEMIDKREQAPRLPVMVLLEHEVQNLSDAHVYLDETNPKAPLATDLLLGTQGWRRYATMDPAKFVAAYGDAARRVLVNVMRAQLGTGSAVITGTAQDSSGALIPGVTVTATAIDLGLSATVTTNESGAYNFVSLPPGRYVVSASLPGFQTRTYTGIDLREKTTRRYNFNLAVAAMASKVEVRVDENMILATQGASVGQVLNPDAVRDLPLVGNDVLDLITVMGGVPHGAMTRDGIQAVDTRDPNGFLALTPVSTDLVNEIRLFRNPKEIAQGQQGLRKAVPSGFIVVAREYAHVRRADWAPGSRNDFAETVYWNAGIKTNSSTGIATVSFDLSDSVTSFRVLADGFASNGSLGSAVSHVDSVQPFSIEPKIPLHVTSGDVIQLPLGIVNGMSTELRGAEIDSRPTAGLKFAISNNAVNLRAKERTRRLMQIDVAHNFRGTADLTINANAGAYRDSVARQIEVHPLGFPYERSTGGVLDANGSQSFTFTLPSEIVPGSVSSSVMVYPTPLANLTQALQGLLREPHGCFEQTSSTSYPMVMAQQYFLTHAGVDPAIIDKTRNLLDTSYKRLIGFESRSGGFEIFGGDPANEAITAYGLMQFTDMSRVRNVDKEMLDRTRTWLLSRRNGEGGFRLNAHGGHGLGEGSADTTNAYITWALVEAGQNGLEREIAAVKRAANSTQDSYVIALAANILKTTGDREGARLMMEKLAKAQDRNGSVTGAKASISYSFGNSLAIETTALAALAWMREPDFANNAQKSMKWILESNTIGTFGSTQSTILALRAIVAHDAVYARPKAAGRLVLTVDGEPVGSPVVFEPNSTGAIALPEFTEGLGPGKHTIALSMEDGSPMPFSMTVKYNSTLPDSSEQAQIAIQVALKDRQVQEGGVTEAIVSIANRNEKAIPTPIAIVGIPGGLELRHDQLKELVKAGRIDAYEVVGPELILYWRSLKAKDTFDIPLSMVAAVPGTYAGPASRSYLYYTNEHKTWAPGLKVTISPRSVGAVYDRPPQN
jgi:hypothetical protein